MEVNETERKGTEGKKELLSSGRKRHPGKAQRTDRAKPHETKTQVRDEE